jgi:hypothetical protein
MAQRDHGRSVLVPQPRRAGADRGKAGDGRPPCKHIIAALALARLDGYRLEEPKT